MNKTRPKQLSFRVNEEEYQKLQERVQESGKNQQEYILSCVLDKKNRQYGRNQGTYPGAEADREQPQPDSKAV